MQLAITFLAPQVEAGLFCSSKAGRRGKVSKDTLAKFEPVIKDELVVRRSCS